MNTPKNPNQAFDIFHKHVAEIRNTRFGQALLDPSTTSVQLTSATGSLPSMPNVDEDDFRSFILGARLLAQDNDRVSLRRIWELAVETFDKNDPSHQWLARFNCARMPYNLHIMCDSPWAESDNTTYTHADIVDIFLWGKYSHLKEQHEKTLHRWMANPITYELMKQSFILSMHLLLECAENLSKEILAASSGDTQPPSRSERGKESNRLDIYNIEMRNQVRNLAKEVVAFATTRLKLMKALIEAVERCAKILANTEPSRLDPHNERRNGLGSGGSLSPLGEVITYEIFFPGARLFANNINIDPDRSVTFEITHTNDWNTQVTVFSDFSHQSVVLIESDSDDFSRALEAISIHCHSIFDSWPLDDKALELALEHALGNSA